MYRIALNTSIAHLSKEKRRGNYEPINELILNKADTSNFLAEERVEILYAHIKQLSKIEKAIILLIISIIILFLIPILSFHSIHKIRSVNIPDNNYKQSLLEYSKGKLQFVFVQKLSFYLGAVLFLTALPVMGRLIAGKDLFIETRLWLWYVVGYPFFYGFSRWVFKKYAKTTAEAEDILRELENS